MNTAATSSWRKAAGYALLALLAIRLLALWAIPLTDTTEARYAEIARKMLETGNWVTPLHDYGVPFWAKPPLSTWLSAASMGLFGVNEFAARLPALLLAIGALWLTADLMRRRAGNDAAMAAALILGGGLLFYGAAGTVMTDPSLMFCVTLSQVAFWHAMSGGGRPWRYAFFAGLGLGLLAKGPLAVVLVGMPIFVWVLVRNQWKALWRELPWISGTLLAAAIALPWYAWAEIRTPGFLNYFIMGEHVSRFLDAGWKGDKYGFAHATPRGMIWPYALGALFPWSIAMLAWLASRARRLPAIVRAGENDGWLLYVSLWTVMTLLFFTMSGNIIFPYSLPMLPGAALLMAELWHRGRDERAGRALPWLALSSGLLVLAAIGLQWHDGARYFRTQKPVIAAWRQQQPAPQATLFYWDSRREFSAEFYSQGRVRTTADAHALAPQLAAHPGSWIVTEQRDFASLPPAIAAGYLKAGEFPVMKDRMLLLKPATAH
ncbi:PMT family glycosyltransferase ArnT/Agl22, involved in glycosylation of proteins and lipid IVA [Chromobacterium violaceum]|uniref:ArnT family glycosyltransferase n=1 Tax=Chromobacterium violaceum TaxID=536 RepID=UPI0005D39B2A|nr:glycosyltransferase family 39 protein [Chromobacterium violaceum]KJH65727.1 dolichyl-phosphate-mannose-protein mannosyltransferase [Chromobacterium violaceum]OQS48286.1 dolichyl-phosphate-mannose--protein mannosyltransferase [Chromobacterium violaceum]OQS49798.1 dolichyl-phosphate-mannose--protein mannosyltransferase [Chromobacterium violaceum]